MSKEVEGSHSRILDEIQGIWQLYWYLRWFLSHPGQDPWLPWVQSSWPRSAQVEHHEQDQNVHILGGYKNDRWLFWTLFWGPSFPSKSAIHWLQTGRHDQNDGENRLTTTQTYYTLTTLSGLTDFKTRESTNGQQPCWATGEEQQQSKTNWQTQEQLSSLQPHVLKTSDLGNFENCELNIGITIDLSSPPSSHVPLPYM